jgi:ParB/RepB/Spo0J family partition protein
MSRLLHSMENPQYVAYEGPKSKRLRGSKKSHSPPPDPLQIPFSILHSLESGQHFLRSIVPIKVSDMVDMPFTIRSSPQVGQEYSDNIKTHGVVTPPTVIPRSDGKFAVVFGHRRKEAALVSGIETIDCIVRTDLSDLDAYKLALAENTYISPNSMELAHFLLKLKSEYSLTQRELARSAALTEQEISNLLRVYRDEVLREKILAGELKLNPALELLHLKSTLPQMTIDGWRAFVDERSLRKTSEIRKLARSRKLDDSGHVGGKCFSCGGRQSLKWKKIRICPECAKGK